MSISASSSVSRGEYIVLTGGREIEGLLLKSLSKEGDLLRGSPSSIRIRIKLYVAAEKNGTFLE